MQISAFIDNKTSRRANILWLLVLLIAFTIPISQWVCVRLIFVALVFSLFVSQSILSVRSVFSTSWDIMLYLMVLLIGLTYSEELSFGLSVIETNFSFFAVPLIFNKVENFNKEKLYQVLYVFTFGLICSSLICLANACFHFDGDAHIFFFYQFVGLLDFQPTYFAYYLIVAICFGLYILYFDRALISDKWVILILSFLFLILMLTGGLTTFMSILLILSFFFLKYILAKKGGIKIIVFSIVVTMLATMFVFSFIYKALDSEPNKITDHWERSALWESAIQANSNILIGVGTGDYRKVLNQFYIEHNLLAYADQNYNSHNQFIQIFFSNGLIGLISLVILLSRPFYMSIRSQNLLGALILFPFFIYGMTEVFLGRFQGVIFFAFLHQLFITFYKRYSLP